MADFDKWITGVGPQKPVGEIARAALEQRLGAVVHFLPLAAYLAEEDLQYVHAARVTTRRAMAALRLFSPFVSKKRSKRMKSTLRTIRLSMGDARDLDVYLQRLNQPESSADDSRSEVTTLFRDWLTRKRYEAQQSIRQCAAPLLDRDKLRRRVARLLKSTGEAGRWPGAEQPFGEWAHRQMGRQWEVFLLSIPGDQPHPEELHRLRIAGKRLRYSMELLAAGLPPRVRKEIYPSVTHLQTKLGEIQDHAVAAERLKAWRKKRQRKSERLLLAQLQQQERDQYQTKSKAFAQQWRREHLAEWQTAFGNLSMSQE